MIEKEVLIVIASFADGYLDNLLTSIEENTKDVIYDVQVVDNHTDDEKLKALVIPVCEKHNVPLHLDKSICGYSDALNTGVNISPSKSKYILYIDSDTLVTSGWLREMLDCYERHENDGCKMVGPLVKDFNNNYLPGVPELYGNPDLIENNDLFLEKGYLIGVCILRRRDTLNLFKWDKNYFRAYWEDNDLTEQVRFLGGKIWIAGKSLMKHKVNSSHETMKKKNINPSNIGAFNRQYFFEKWKLVTNYYDHPEINKMVLGEFFIRKIPEEFK